jgi:hypothetical protein
MMTGQMLRDTQLAFFEMRDADFLEHCRTIAADIARQRGQVSINEVRKAINIPEGVHPSVLGAVFKSKKFIAIGYTEATHKAAHARVVRVYKLKEETCQES